MNYRSVSVKGHTVELLPGEKVISVEPKDQSRPARLPDATGEVLRLTGAASASKVGAQQPAVASLGLATDPADHDFHRFEVVFGRDSQIVAEMLESLYPALRPTTFRYLAARQGLSRKLAPDPSRYDVRDEEEGRIPHEIRDPKYDPLAKMLMDQEGWGWPFYRSDDATLLFARDLAEAGGRNRALLSETIVQRDGAIRDLGYSLGKASGWILGKIANPEGLLYSRRPRLTSPSRKELPAFPVWMDSGDAAVREDGTLAMGDVAWAECQGQAYDALSNLARLSQRLTSGHRRAWNLENPDVYVIAARKLRKSVLAHFFYQEQGEERAGFGVELVHGTPTTLKVLKSNVGHLLGSTILDGEKQHIDTVVRSLLDPAYGLITPNGVRTLSDGNPRFRPGAYHCGTVWLFDNHLIAQGLRRHGYVLCAKWLDARVLSVCKTLRKYPEYIRGDMTVDPKVNDAVVRVESTDPVFGTWENPTQQPGQNVQAWTLAAFVEIVSKHLASRAPTTGVPEDRRMAAGISRFVAGIARYTVAAKAVA